MGLSRHTFPLVAPQEGSLLLKNQANKCLLYRRLFYHSHFKGAHLSLMHRDLLKRTQHHCGESCLLPDNVGVPPNSNDNQILSRKFASVIFVHRCSCLNHCIFAFWRNVLSKHAASTLRAESRAPPQEPPSAQSPHKTGKLSSKASIRAV